MNINSILKKEGIKIVKPLDTLTINKLAKSITDKLCLAFLEFGLDNDELFINISRMKMFIAQMPENLSHAKYYYKDDSIYFSNKLSVSDIEELAVHECIHFVQKVLDDKGNLLRLGLCLYPETKVVGAALNEAAVQLMACVANRKEKDTVKYYGITFPTISPSSYALECSLLSQMAYFTGDYPLYHSTLNSNNIFQNTFSVKSSWQTFETIREELDNLMKLEDELNSIISELTNCDGNTKKIQRLNKEIEYGKKLITEKFFSMQDAIILNCFTSEFNSVKTLEDISIFKSRLYDFKNFIGHSDTYTFYNSFYCNMMTEIEKKVEYIKENGPIDLLGSLNPGMSIVPTVKTGLSLFKRILVRLGILVER